MFYLEKTRLELTSHIVCSYYSPITLTETCGQLNAYVEDANKHLSTGTGRKHTCVTKRKGNRVNYIYACWCVCIYVYVCVYVFVSVCIFTAISRILLQPMVSPYKKNRFENWITGRWYPLKEWPISIMWTALMNWNSIASSRNVTDTSL